MLNFCSYLIYIISIQNWKCSFFCAKPSSNQKKWEAPALHWKIRINLIERKKK